MLQRYLKKVLSHEITWKIPWKWIRIAVASSIPNFLKTVAVSIFHHLCYIYLTDFEQEDTGKLLKVLKKRFAGYDDVNKIRSLVIFDRFSLILSEIQLLVGKKTDKFQFLKLSNTVNVRLKILDVRKGRGCYVILSKKNVLMQDIIIASAWICVVIFASIVTYIL